MVLTLKVTRYQNAFPQQEMSVTVGESGCSIGRGDGNDFVLPDPDRWVSSRHANIRFRDGRFCLIDQSSNGTFLNGRAERLPPGQEIPLNDGDELTIGSYEIQVSVVQGREPGTPAIDPFASREPPGAFDPFDQQRPVDDQFGQKEFRQGAAAGGDVLRRPVLESEPPEALPEGEATPDILDLVGRDADSDWMAPATGGVFPRSPDYAPPAAQDAEGLLAGPPRGPVADDKRLEFREIERGAGGARHDHTPQEDAFFRAPEAIPDDYDLLGTDSEIEPEPDAEEAFSPESAASDAELDLLGSAPAPADLEPIERPHADEQQPPPPPEKPRPPTHGAPPVESAYQHATDDRAVAAFMAGLGYRDQPLPIGNTAEVMETAGALLRAMTEGLISVMRSRSSFKSELRIEMTTIQSVENNPFKFSVNADDALNNLLFRRTRGFLSPVYAANQAYEDVQAHEMAMLAGLRAMLRALFLRFDPSKLEERFGREASIANRLPMAKKAKCWDYLTEIYAEVAADAGDDFQRLFGDAFTRAYEEQVQRLKEGRGHKAGG